MTPFVVSWHPWVTWANLTPRSVRHIFLSVYLFISCSQSSFAIIESLHEVSQNQSMPHCIPKCSTIMTLSTAHCLIHTVHCSTHTAHCSNNIVLLNQPFVFCQIRYENKMSHNNDANNVLFIIIVRHL